MHLVNAQGVSQRARRQVKRIFGRCRAWEFGARTPGFVVSQVRKSGPGAPGFCGFLQALGYGVWVRTPRFVASQVRESGRGAPGFCGFLQALGYEVWVRMR